MRDWLYWLDQARTMAVRAGTEHRQYFTVISEAYTWCALDERMRAAGLHHLRDAPLFRAAKTLYQRTECETARGFAPADGETVQEVPVS